MPVKCFTKEDDAKLARGWPYLVVPIDDGTKDKRAAAAAKKAWGVIDPIHFTEWSRPVLERYLRAAIDTLFVKEPNDFDGPAPTPDEAIDGLRKMFREGYDTYRFKEAEFAYGVEAIAGTDATLAAIADEIAKFTTGNTDGFNYDCRGAIAQTTAFMMLRASPNVVKDARAKMERGLAKGGPKQYEHYFDALGYVLHGAKVLSSRAYKWWAMDLWQILCLGPTLDFAADDPEWVREQVAKSPKAQLSVRVAWIAGPTALEGLANRKWPARMLPSVLRDFGMLRDPRIVPFMLSYVGKSSVKDAPMKWFRAHADFARPILEKSKGEVAKAVLKQL
jgi:hypothetical protein